ADFARQLDIFKGQTDMAPYVSLTDQRSIEIDIPRIADQRAIADVLGALDDKTAANARVVEAAESLMVNTVAAVDRWEPLSAIACHSTVSIKPEQFDKTVAHFSLPAFDAGADPELVDGETIKSTKFVLAERCVLFSKLNPRIPRIWNVEALPREMALASTEFVVLIPRGADSSALWATLAQPDVSEKLRQMVAGTSGSHQRIRPQDLLNVEVRDVRTLGTSAAEMVRQLSQVCYTRRQESQRLARTRDELLPLLMSGKLRVKDAENMAAEAL
ncbi:restriction endonuclease subunit S, partial [Mycolicibacterium fortuitum]|uniref:restriction endonuclease subunit S n=2 Tax=Mycobacteriaceae TaxID=1762 RepID=UPI0034CFE86F